MLGRVWSFWIDLLSRIFTWVFTLQINDDPPITIGMLILGFFALGLFISFILLSDFFKPNDLHNYEPKHVYKPKHGKE